MVLSSDNIILQQQKENATLTGGFLLLPSSAAPKVTKRKRFIKEGKQPRVLATLTLEYSEAWIKAKWWWEMWPAPEVVVEVTAPEYLPVLAAAPDTPGGSCLQSRICRSTVVCAEPSVCCIFSRKVNPNLVNFMVKQLMGDSDV
ncbi:uncharacterized protein GJ701_008666 isoform 1-T1 [Geothlypis trichas]